MKAVFICPSPQELHRVLQVPQYSDLWVTHRCTQRCHGVDDVSCQSVEIQSSMIDLLLDQLHVQHLVHLRPQSDVTGQQKGLKRLREIKGCLQGISQLV